VCKMHKQNAHTSIQVQRKHSGLPCAMALRLMPWSPRRRIRSCLRRRRITGWSNPVGLISPPSTWHQQRAPGPHGFAVRDYRRSSARCDRSREARPAIPFHARRGRVHRNPPQRSRRWPTPLRV